MSNPVTFQTQLASIMEVLANAAVAEICELVDSGYAVLHLEISRSQKENEALKRKLRLSELKVARASALRTAGTGSSIFNSSRARAQLVSESRRTPGPGLEAQFPRGRDFQLSSSGIRRRDADPPLLLSSNPHPPLILSSNSPSDGQRPITTPKKQAVILSQAVSLASSLARPDPKSPVIKVEKVDDIIFEDVDQQERLRESDHGLDEGQIDTIVVQPGSAQPISKQEPAGPGSTSSCGWSGDDDANKPLYPDTKTPNASKRTQNPDMAAADLHLDPVAFDCMLYEPHSQGPLAEDPSCSYSLKMSVNVGGPAHPDHAADFPFAVATEASRSVSDQPPAAYRDGRQQREPSSENQPPARDDVVMDTAGASSSSFLIDDDWDSHNSSVAPGYGGGGGDLDKLFICSFCGKTLACLKNLKTHMRVHTGEKPFSCAQCGKRFSDSSNLKRHQSVHTGERRYGCMHCGKRFAQSGSLKVHMSVHTGCKQFKCPHCGKTFISANHLRRHVSVHDGEKLNSNF